MTFLSPDLYAQIEASVPIPCVDFVPLRHRGETAQVGLILRESPFGRVWCHLGGRVRHGETVADALRRHARDTLAVSLDLPLNPQPRFVYEWFPPEIAPTDGTVYGDDPRKHSIALSYVVTLGAEAPQPQNEAIDFGWFAVDALPTPMWPGSADMIARLAIS